MWQNFQIKMYVTPWTMLCRESNSTFWQGLYRQVWVKFRDLSRTSPASPTVFKDLKLMKKNWSKCSNSPSEMLERDNGDISTGKLVKKIMCLYLVQHMLHQIKAQQFYTDLGLLSTVLSSTENSRIQGLFKAFEWFSRTFQGIYNFQGLFKKVL